MRDMPRNDPLFSQQWYLLNSCQNGGTPGIDINVVPVWQDYTGKCVVVAVVDQGIEYTHPDLGANVDTQISFSGSVNGLDGQPITSSDRAYDSYLVGAMEEAIIVSNIAGTKTITNVEALSFADRVVPTNELLGTQSSASFPATVTGGLA